MRSSNKARSRNKNNRRSNNTGNVVNRVFDSAGPEGRVRGTPQQIIEKYRALAHDAALADDRVGAESFHQHAEHYSRMLLAAQQQIAERQAEQQAQQAQRQQQQQQPEVAQNQPEKTAQSSDEQPEVSAGFVTVSDEQPEVDENLVTTPESKPRRPRNPRGRKPVKTASKEEAPAVSEDQPQPH